MVTTASPTVLRRYIAFELARLRKAAGLKREEVAASLRCSLAHVGHVETMVALSKVPEVRALLQLYGVAERTDDFVALVDAARRGKDWFTGLPGIPEDFELLLAMEAGAVIINSFDTMVVPGLFQTPAYAESIIRGGEPHLPDTEVEQLLQLRMVRQDVLNRQPDPPKIWCILDEAVLRRELPGKPAVLRDQLEDLVRLSARPNVHIQVLPLTASGHHPGIDGKFIVLTFAPELVNDPGVAYTESRIRGTYYEDPAEVAEYRDTWNEIQLHALDPDQSQDLLARRSQEIHVP